MHSAPGTRRTVSRIFLPLQITAVSFQIRARFAIAGGAGALQTCYRFSETLAARERKHVCLLRECLRYRDLSNGDSTGMRVRSSQRPFDAG